MALLGISQILNLKESKNYLGILYTLKWLHTATPPGSNKYDHR